MIITCPRCSTRYVIDPAVLAPNGRQAGCSNCGHYWTEPPPALGEDTTPAEAASEPDLAAPPPVPSEPPPALGEDTTPAKAVSAPDLAATPPVPSEPPEEDTEAPWPPETQPDQQPESQPDWGTEPEIESETEPAADSELPTPDTEEPPPETREPASLSAYLNPAGAPATVADKENKPSVPEPPESKEPEVLADVGKPAPVAAGREPIPAALRVGKPPAERGKQNQKKKPSLAMLAGLGALAAFVVIAIMAVAAVNQIVSAIPGTAGFYRAVGLLGDELGAGLEIRDVRSARRRDGADEILTIEGIVANVTDEPVDLPLIRVSLSDADGQELQYVTVPPNQPILPPGETVSFETLITNPSAIVRRVKVKFVSPSDSSLPPGADDGG